MSESARPGTDQQGTQDPAATGGTRVGAERVVKLSGWQQLLATGQFVECIFSCAACGESGTSVARPRMLEGKTCGNCGELVAVTVI